MEDAGADRKDVSGPVAPRDVPSKASGSGAARARYSRMKLFEKIIQRSLEKFVDVARGKQIPSMFRPLLKKNPKMFERIHQQFVEELQKAIQEDINRMAEEGRLESRLKELDKLETEAMNSPDPAWRPSGVPEEDLCSFLIPYYQKQEAFMQKQLKKVQAENAALAEKVAAGRESIARTERSVAAAVDEWKATVTEFESVASSLHPGNVLGL